MVIPGKSQHFHIGSVLSECGVVNKNTITFNCCASIIGIVLHRKADNEGGIGNLCFYLSGGCAKNIMYYIIHYVSFMHCVVH